MGDNLAELLYRAFCNGGGYVYGSNESPSWHNLPSEEREAWEHVATKARTELNDRFARDLIDASTTFNADQAIANLREQLAARHGR